MVQASGEISCDSVSHFNEWRLSNPSGVDGSAMPIISEFLKSDSSKNPVPRGLLALCEG